jgi:hypothetical protein
MINGTKGALCVRAHKRRIFSGKANRSLRANHPSPRRTADCFPGRMNLGYFQSRLVLVLAIETRFPGSQQSGKIEFHLDKTF